jgi:hypothetical protein
MAFSFAIHIKAKRTQLLTELGSFFTRVCGQETAKSEWPGGVPAKQLGLYCMYPKGSRTPSMWLLHLV